MYEKFHVTCLILENKNYKKIHCLWWPWQGMKKWKELKRILSILTSFANFSNCTMTCWISLASGPHGGQMVAPVPTCNTDDVNWGSFVNRHNSYVSNAIHGNVYIFHSDQVITIHATTLTYGEKHQVHSKPIFTRSMNRHHEKNTSTHLAVRSRAILRISAIRFEWFSFWCFFSSSCSRLKLATSAKHWCSLWLSSRCPSRLPRPHRLVWQQ